MTKTELAQLRSERNWDLTMHFKCGCIYYPRLNFLLCDKHELEILKEGIIKTKKKSS